MWHVAVCSIGMLPLPLGPPGYGGRNGPAERMKSHTKSPPPRRVPCADTRLHRGSEADRPKGALGFIKSQAMTVGMAGMARTLTGLAAHPHPRRCEERGGGYDVSLG